MARTVFTVGGTVQAGGGRYLKRKVDEEFLELCRKGEFAFVLTARQGRDRATTRRGRYALCHCRSQPGGRPGHPGRMVPRHYQ
jgi:hypothetical protein